MKARITDKMIQSYSGFELWEYMFEGVPLPKKVTEHLDEEEKWKTEGEEWLESIILEDEDYKLYEKDERYAFTSKGRFFNIKYKKQSRLMLHSKALRVNMGGTTHSVTKLIKKYFDEDVTIDNLCDEAKGLVTVVDISSKKR